MISREREVGFSLAAAFVIERRTGQGYVVTETVGQEADGLKDEALGLLDELGQPNPKGPDVTHFLLGPFRRGGGLVAVTVTLLESGEARYRQWWYRPRAPRKRRRRWLLPLCLILVGIVLGSSISRLFVGLTKPEIVVVEQPSTPPPEPKAAVNHARLQKELMESRDVRNKLRNYLSMDGFAAPKGDVVQVKPAVMLNSVLVPNVIPRDRQREDLDTEEVRILVDLLDGLRDWQESLSRNDK